MNINQLADAYLTDKDSNFHSRRYVTRKGYTRLLARISADLGTRDLSDLRIREIKQQHDAWKADGKVSMAHSLITMLRVIIGFGSAMLEDPDCIRIRPLLSQVNFPNGKPRTVWLTAQQAKYIRDVAFENSYYCIALAQAFQQDCAFRQKDVIGEWVPVAEPIESSILSRDGTLKWVRGITREEVDAHMVLRHQTSKRGQVLTFHLENCPAVMEEWDFAPESGPMIIDPETDLPYEAWKFRRIWRRLADEADVPKNVWNMDSRAGRITGVIDAGASLEDARKLAGHENQHTTARYSRDAEAAINRSLEAAKKKGQSYQDFAKDKWNQED